MALSQKTSITLLKDLAGGAASARWGEFVARYDGLMRGYLQSRFPDVDADDVMQETLLSMTKALPGYRYTPDAKGCFRDYLVGVLRHKALDALRKRASEREKRSAFANERDLCAASARDDVQWREALMHAALDQLLADDSIAMRNREIFRRVAMLGDPPERVAADFGVSRGNVDVIKNRLLARMRAIVESMARNG